MGSFRPERRIFPRGDNVVAYWIDHAEGFEVRSGLRFRARVDAVVVDPRHGRATTLVVRSARLHRRYVIPAQAVTAVDPFAKRLEIEREARRSIPRASRAAAHVALAFALCLSRLVAWLTPRARRAASDVVEGAHRVAAGGYSVVMQLGKGAAVRLRSGTAWLQPLLASGAARTWAFTAASGAKLRPRLAEATRTAFKIAFTIVYLALLEAVTAAAWAAPRLRASTGAAAVAALSGEAAARRGVHAAGQRLSHGARHVSSLRRG